MFHPRSTRIAALFMGALLLLIGALPAAAISNVTFGPVIAIDDTGGNPYNASCAPMSGLSFSISYTYTPDGTDTLITDLLPPDLDGEETGKGMMYSDFFVVQLIDGEGNLLDSVVIEEPWDTTPQQVTFSLSLTGMPAVRPFFVVLRDLTGNIPDDVLFDQYAVETLNYINQNGVLVAYTMFDPAEQVADCARLPLLSFESGLPDASACPDVPAGSVVGDLPFSTQAYYAPGQQANGVIIDAGTYWVIGVDEREEYYKIALACDFLWVPVEAMQPSFQPPWQGEPLPTQVVR